MDSTNGVGPNASPSHALSPESLALFAEGISLVLFRWTALQMSVENGWCGRDYRRKFEELSASLLSCFTQSKAPPYIDDLEDMLDESMVLSFNMETDDGSIEEVAELLMIMHEDCLKGNYESIQQLRKSNPGTNAISQCRQVIDENEDESSDEEVLDMIVDEPKSKDMVADEQKPNDSSDDEGWSVVAPRRNRGKRSV